MRSKLDYCLWLAALVAMLSACAGRHTARPVELPTPDQPRSEPIPQAEPLAAYGNHSPYRVAGETYYVLPSANGYVATGVASWYGLEFHGRATSSQETFDMYAYTAAHRSLPLPSIARITNMENGLSVTVRVNDRGPFKKNRLIDLSYAAALKLAMVEQGTAQVEVRVLNPHDRQPRPPVASAEHIYLQLGAFGKHANALTFLRQLRAKRFANAQVQSITLTDGGTIHRVRIGPLANIEAADALAQRIGDSGFEQPQIIFE